MKTFWINLWKTIKYEIGVAPKQWSDIPDFENKLAREKEIMKQELSDHGRHLLPHEWDSRS